MNQTILNKRLMQKKVACRGLIFTAVRGLIGLTLVLCLIACSRDAMDLTADEIAQNNRGVALMGQYRNEDARAVFAALVDARPNWLDARVNLAIATLNRQREGDERAALAIVQQVLEQQPSHVRARYVAALLHFYLGDGETALPDFMAVGEAAPDDAHVAYFTGQVLAQLDRPDEALASYRRAIELDPYLRSAYYGSALSLRKLGDADGARAMLAEYQRFENNPRAHLAEFRYTRKGRLAEALAVDSSSPAGPPHDPQGPLFDPPRRISALNVPAANGHLSLTTADINQDGLQDVFLANAGGLGQVWIQRASGFELAHGHPLAHISKVRAAAWGAPDISDRLGVYLCRHGENRLMLNEHGDWIESPASATLADSGECADAAWVDADHDGDLDVLVVNRSGGNELYNNNFNDSFRALSEPHAPLLAGRGQPGRQLLAVDLDADRDVDHLIVNVEPPHQVLINDRLWQYSPGNAFEALAQADFQALTAADLNADGQIELISLETDGRLRLWQPDAQSNWRASTLIALGKYDQPRLAAQDFDGDGRPDLLVQHANGFAIFDVNLPAAANAEPSVNLRFEQSVSLRALVPVLMNPERGLALAGVVQSDDGLSLQLWPAGSGRHAFVSIQPTGRSDRAEGIRSNSSGIGTGLVVRAGQQWVITDTYDRDSSPGQSLQPAVVGLGGQSRADFIRLFWTDGVLQTELDLAAGQVHDIAENQRQLASCPVLFAHNGERFEFVSDVLGVAGIGFLLEPGRYSTPRPWEFFQFPADSIQPTDGRYRLKIGEPMQEIAYIDSARLHLYDLPDGWSMTRDERMFTGSGAEPTGRAVFYRDASRLLPERVLNDRLQDVTDTLLRVDQTAAPVGPLDPRFLGLLRDSHVLTMEFDRVINPPGQRPVLVGNGWVEYPYSQTVFAAWQAERRYEPPSLEAYAGGRWQPVYEHFGYPAGMPREMSLALEDLPPNTTALRLRSNLQIYWDRLMVIMAESSAGVGIRHHAVSIDGARLAKTGFARRDTLAQRRPFYDYQDRTPFWDTEYQTGFYTAYGPVEPLVRATNNAYALVGPGEELQLEFIEPAGPPEGYHRVVALEVHGYAKDMDLYTDTGATVGPMPFTSEVGNRAQRDRLHDRFHTRFQGGH